VTSARPSIIADGVFVELGGVMLLGSTSLEVASGEVTAVVGPSGSGKTTLLRCLSGLITVTGGEVRVSGESFSGRSVAWRAAFRRTHIGMIFQDPELLDELSIEENVALPLLFSGEPRSSALKRARESLVEVGVGHLAHRRIHQVSGGEAQRVSVARAMVVAGRCIIADEPTASLDQDNAHAVARLIVDHAHSQEVATVISTHDPAVAELCDHVVSLRREVSVR